MEYTLYDTISVLFPLHSATLKVLVDQYEQQCQHFMASTTVSQFKKLFPASATPYKLSAGKTFITLKIKKQWDSDTLDDLADLVNLFGDSGNHLHLSRVEQGCIAVTWFVPTIDVKNLKEAIFNAAESFQAKKVLQVFVGDELMWECSQPKQPTQGDNNTLCACTEAHFSRNYNGWTAMSGHESICSVTNDCSY